MISVEQAHATILAAFQPLPAEVVGLEDALDRVLAEDVTARLTQPPDDVSAMDGYALRAADAAQPGASLEVIGLAAAGAGYVGSVGAGQAVRIFTGAPVPAGADAILIQEHADIVDRRVIVRTPPRPGRHIRRQGQDFAVGEVVLPAGRRLTPRDVGLAAAMNVPWLPVHRRPRVAILATGDELVMPGEAPGPGCIVASAGFAVAAFLRRFGAEPLHLGIARDDAAALAAQIRAARGADLLLTIGGASVGDFDLIRPVLGNEGFDLGFYKVAMRPGKPLIFGRLGELPVLGLPGNPVSACVTLLVFARPAIDAMQGLRRPEDGGYTGEGSAVLGAAMGPNEGRQDYVRASLCRQPDGEWMATPLPMQDSALMRAFAEADCLIIRPPTAPPAAPGERVRILRLSD